MTAERIHRTVSADGTEIADRVMGQGQPLALLHGAIYSGETAFDELVPQLTDHYTCFLPSTHGRGLSGDADEHLPERLLEDVLATITSPVLLLQGDRTLPWFDRGRRHVVKRTPNAENRIIAGAGHGGPGLMPEAVSRGASRPCCRPPRVQDLVEFVAQPVRVVACPSIGEVMDATTAHEVLEGFLAGDWADVPGTTSGSP